VVANLSIAENRTLSFTDGNGTLPVTCPADGPSTCTGSIELRSGAPPAGKLAKAKTTILGKAKYKIKRGKRGNVRIKLSRSARSQLKKKKKLKAHLVTLTKGPDGKTVSGTVAVNLKHRR
jgi:hypothetical protein